MRAVMNYVEIKPENTTTKNKLPKQQELIGGKKPNRWFSTAMSFSRLKAFTTLILPAQNKTGCKQQLKVAVLYVRLGKV